MFGYACNETKEYMPLSITLAHKLMLEATRLRENNNFLWARPDMKAQVTIDYTNTYPQIDTILMSIQHDPDYDEKVFKDYIKNKIIKNVVDAYHLHHDYKVLINPTGRFVIGGPQGDTGLIGRKIIVDTYGGMARHGGGTFSGKDPSKVDRSGAYMARYIAKNLVASHLCDKAEIQLSYAIGMAEPISIYIDTFNTNKVSLDILLSAIRKEFILTPQGIIDTFDLLKPIYLQTACYGHFGRDDIDLPWEKLNKVNDLKKYI